MRWTFAIMGACLAAALALVGGVPVQEAHAEDVTLIVWSHEADEPAKVTFREQVARDLEKQHPGLHIKITWFEKNPLYTALRTALPAGRGPDVFYLEPDQLHQYVAATLGLALSGRRMERPGAFPRRSTTMSFIITRTGRKGSASSCRLVGSLARVRSSIS